MKLTVKELERILREFGIEPDAKGNYHRKDFERAWKLMAENPNISDRDLKKKLLN
jgi:hypothetical protein